MPAVFMAKKSQVVRFVDVPGLANVDEVNTVWTGLPEVWLHVYLNTVSHPSSHLQGLLLEMDK